MSILDRVNSPADLRRLSRDELRTLAAEMRARLIDVCSRTGGHIGAGLGVVELSIALHYVFETPHDQLVWDVGHQGYPHKLLTGRNSRMETLRQEGGLSGFLKRSESEYDAFGAGHAATSISAALGIAAARDLQGDDYKVVAIIGDGSLTSGLAYEALNNAGHSDRDFVVVLNDNEMSIAPNVGAMSRYLTQVQRNPLYNRVRDKIGEFVETHGALNTLVRKWEESVKSFLTPGVLFEELGFRYFGPIDGHDLDVLLDTFELVRQRGGPRLVHVITQKGRGFPAGEHGEKWHALPPGHDPATGKQLKVSTANPAYTAVFGKGLGELMNERADVVAITAAMPSGTGVGGAAKAHPTRVFDVGIAEGHGVTFAAGMATRGVRPVVAIYSSFLQRAYDNVIHDVALQSLPVVFAMDRAGLVGEDGETHMGLYDIAYMLAVPNMIVTAPKDGTELLALLRAGLEQTGGPFCVRYPRDAAPELVPAMSAIQATRHATWEVLRRGTDGVAILAVGTMVQESLAAAEALGAEGIRVTVVNCRYLKPHDEVTLAALLASHKTLLVVEEGTVVNGFGAYLARLVEQQDAGVRVIAHGVPDRIIVSASRTRQLALCGLDATGIAARVRALHESEALAG
ncbi:MAG: 1-deoxy-D-xylulose-5-phosphate synthase [Gemmatimonadetes bacterium]|nr:1-deoxy-D-xylulose-5-phosphate synthase [Gemmatimonadota bacterium]MBK6455683.1 1-deoxy-D-xylulose-5-phosphate synthase [Gemmatimonadota bacterium]MBK6841854.1 1-deoxy-D-xylulose-5-phosphate synthase [Gemmatimonadota bacterium]MBK7835557.1 1-deoxy-D-xylulose-5-phosphate synthase [Gemmatimonadota bacterium]MBK9406903.1 1-deoxy-D-xylulose-5-phosphate synthase [Gemmatimonadota bacterium]